MKPFANEVESIGVGGLTVENRTDRVSIYGSLDITRDKAGLALAKQAQALLSSILTALQSEKALPDKVAGPVQPATVKNPFA